MPEDRERTALLGRPVEQLEHARLRLGCREPRVTFLGERRIHHRERHLDEVCGTVLGKVPRPERVRDAGAETEGVREAQRRVVTEANPGERRKVSVWVDAEVVVALPDQRAVELRQERPLARESFEVLRGEVAAVKPDFRTGLEQSLDQPRPEPIVRLGRRAVGPVSVPGHEKERRTSTAPTLFGRDLGEAPVGIGSAKFVQRHPCEPAHLVHRRPDATP